MIKIVIPDRTGVGLRECLYVVFWFKSLARCTKQFANKAMIHCVTKKERIQLEL